MLRRKPVYGLATHWRLLFFAVLGATMGTLLDALHVYNGAAGYSGVRMLPVLNVAWYVPFEFATAGVVVGMLRPELDEELRRKRSDLPGWKVLLGMLILAAVWAASGLLGRAGLSNEATTAILLPISILTWWLFDRTPQGTVAALLTALVGILVESALVHTETYHYTRPDFLGVPMWLPNLYLTACIAVGNLGRFLKYSWDRPSREPEDADDEQPKAA